MLAVLAVAATVAAASALVLVPDSRRAADADPLARAASALDGGPTVVSSGSLGVPPIGPGQYVFTDQEVADRARVELHPDLDYLQPELVRTWRRPDGGGVSVVRYLPPVFDTSEDRTRASSVGLDNPVSREQTLTLPPVASGGAQYADRSYLQALPLDGPSLTRRLRLDLKAGDDARLFRGVLDLLASAPPPQLQAALYQVLAAIPGVRPLPATVDALGRTAQRASLTLDEGVEEVLFSEGTGAFLGSRVLEPTTGKVLSYRLLRAASIAAALPAQLSAPPTARGRRPPETPGATQAANDVP